MLPKLLRIFLPALLLVTATLYGQQPDSTTHKPWAFWWWMGSAVTREGITHNLEAYARAGFGGLSIVPIYGAKGHEKAFISYLTPAWTEMLDHTTREAARLGLGVDMSLGTGWPYGGPAVDRAAAAKKFVLKEWEVPAGKPFRQPVGVDTTAKGAVLQAVSGYTAGNAYRDLTHQVDRQGWLELPAGGPVRRVAALFSAPTGQRVKRAAPGGEGLVMDYFDRAAFGTYAAPFEAAFEGFRTGRYGVRSFYNDSYEAYGANWTDGFFEAFRQRRGYDFRPHLYVLNRVENPTESERRLWSDYHETLSDLLLEHFTKPWAEWCRTRGKLTRNQAHGSPANILDLYAAVAIPETESFGSKVFDIPGYRLDPDYEETRYGRPNPLAMQFASSAAHLTGKPLVSSETSTWLAEHFKVALSQVKPLVDEQFTAGVNHAVFHGITYSPPDEPWPGWLFYASTNYNPQSHLWPDLPDLNGYVARCQALLQTTRPDNDLLLYFPVYDGWHAPGTSAGLHLFDIHYNAREWLEESRFGQTAADLRKLGYAFDYVSDRQLGRLQTLPDGIIRSEGGAAYRAVVVPPCRYLPLETLRVLHQLAGRGVKVLFLKQWPETVNGYHEVDKRQAAFDRLLGELKGKVVLADGITAGLDRLGIGRETLADGQLTFIRKRHPAGRLYFIANGHNAFRQGTIRLQTAAGSIQLYDPLHGRRGTVPFRKVGTEAVELYLQLPPGGSVFVQTFDDPQPGTPWQYFLAAGDVVPVEGDWQITFREGEPALPAPIRTQKLMSWTELGDSAARWFSGTARYACRFSLAGPQMPDGPFDLDLGDVREVAEVRLNGQDLGKAWALPFRVPVPPGVLRRENLLEVDVRNLSANRIARLDRDGVPWRKFYEINFVNIKYEPFNAANWAPVPSGLLGPVRLIPGRWATAPNGH